MSRKRGSSVIPVALFLAILIIALPVSANNATTQTINVTPTTTIPTNQTINVTPTTTVSTNQTINVTPTTTVSTNQTTVATSRTTAVIPKTTVVITHPIITTASPVQTTRTAATTGEVLVISSPPGADILIDGNYKGTTPDTVNDIPAGNHILKLTLRGYYDYEGSIYVVPGDKTYGYGTLQPMNQVTSAPTTVPTVIVPIIIATLTPTPTQDPGLFGNSSVLVAIIGVITALIAAGATVFTHIKPPKKE